MKYLGALLLTVACTSDMARFSLVSTRPTPQRGTVLAEGVQAEECRYIFDSNVVNASPERVIEAAIRSVQGADALVNVRIERTHFPFAALLWGRECLRATGDAVRLGAVGTGGQ